MSKSTPLKILLIQHEPMTWRQGRSYPYCLNFGFADSLEANGAEVTMVTTPWRSRLRDLCHGKQFDQVWFNDLSHFAEMQWDISDLIDLAPVRVGFATESLTHSDEERALHDWIWMRDKYLPRYLAQMTHVAAVDEQDQTQVHQTYGIPTMYHPVPIPKRFVRQPATAAPYQGGYFSGSLYGERGDWLKDQPLLQYQPSTNSGRLEQRTFDFLHQRVLFARVKAPTSLLPAINAFYLKTIRTLRQRTANQWLDGMQQGAAVVNLPHLVKGYSSRVIEGMAAGRPVISWRIPNAPQNEALFEDGKEILLYSTPQELGAHIENVVTDPDWARQIANNARQKLLQHHTSTHRVRQILDWVESGKTPQF